MLLFAAGVCAAGPSPLPEFIFSDLAGVTHHPTVPGEKLASVLFFYWHDCPVCNSYAPEIGRICAAYTNCAFYIVQVDPDLTPTAAQKHATPAQIALAWLLAQKPWIVPIPGTTKLHRLEENIGSTLVELTANDLQELDSATAKITVEGDRYPPDLERMTYR